MSKITQSKTENSMQLLKEIILSPSKAFQHICDKSESYSKLIILSFIGSSLVPLWKSFSKEKVYFSFFESDIANDIISLYSIPQVQWIITFLTFILFSLAIGLLSRLFTKHHNPKGIVFCVMGLSQIGILLQFIFFLIQLLYEGEISILWWISNIWVVILTVMAIKISQQTTYLRSVLIYLFTSIPVIIIIGVGGLAPFLLWSTT